MRYYLLKDNEYIRLRNHKDNECPICTIVVNNLVVNQLGEKEIPSYIIVNNHYKPHIEAELKRELV